MTVAGGPLCEQVLTAQAADETTHDGLFVAAYTNVAAVVVFGTGTSAGVVTLEGAHTKNYAGTWVSVGTPATFATADTVMRIQSVNNAFPYIRARISTAIAGGTVDVVIVAN